MGRGLKFKKRAVRFRMLIAVAFLLASAIFVNLGVAQQKKDEKTFATPDEATDALYTAAKSHDENMLLEIFGPAGKQRVQAVIGVHELTTRQQRRSLAFRCRGGIAGDPVPSDWPE